MVSVAEVITSLPDFKKADKLLTKYLNQHKENFAFDLKNYFNNTSSEIIGVKAKYLDEVVKELKKQKKERYYKKFLDFLWQSNVFEKKMIAVKGYAFIDVNFNDFEKIAVGFDNWAHVDLFCMRVSGPYFLSHPKEVIKLEKFALSKNPWFRRFAAVSLISVLKDEYVEHDVALKILDLLVVDEAQREVLTASDWMIREFIKKNYEKGYNYLVKWASHYAKTGNKKVRWVLIRARHKLKKEHKKEIEELIGF